MILARPVEEFQKWLKRIDIQCANLQFFNQKNDQEQCIALGEQWSQIIGTYRRIPSNSNQRTKMWSETDFDSLIESINTHTRDSILCDIIVAQVKTCNMHWHGSSEFTRDTREICSIEKIVHTNHPSFLGLGRFDGHHENIKRNTGLDSKWQYEINIVVNIWSR